MYIKEDTQHNILFFIAAAIFFIFTTGMADTNETNGMAASTVEIIAE